MDYITVLNFILQNWDTIGLIITNIIALFINPPFRNKETQEEINNPYDEDIYHGE
jgi:hypothetical protein